MVPFVDLKAQYHSIRDEVRAEVDNVFESTQFILGDAVEKFERDFAGFLGVKHVIGVGSGLDALRLALEAAGVGVGDEVIIPGKHFYRDCARRLRNRSKTSFSRLPRGHLSNRSRIDRTSHHAADQSDHAGPSLRAVC